MTAARDALLAGFGPLLSERQAILHNSGVSPKSLRGHGPRPCIPDRLSGVRRAVSGRYGPAPTRPPPRQRECA